MNQDRRTACEYIVSVEAVDGEVVGGLEVEVGFGFEKGGGVAVGCWRWSPGVRAAASVKEAWVML